jgi:hypothetical protein
LDADRADASAAGRNRGDMQHGHAGDESPHESFVHHPIHATVHEAEHAREIADAGESAATPVILAAAVLAFIVPLAAILIALDFEVPHL